MPAEKNGLQISILHPKIHQLKNTFFMYTFYTFIDVDT